jgi:hypothetical protein
MNPISIVALASAFLLLLITAIVLYKYKKLEFEEDKDFFLKKTYAGWFFRNGKYVAILIYTVVFILAKTTKG